MIPEMKRGAWTDAPLTMISRGKNTKPTLTGGFYHPLRRVRNHGKPSNREDFPRWTTISRDPT
jgi:hypothetical protein